MATIQGTSRKTTQERTLEQAVRTKNNRVLQLRNDFDIVAPELITDYEVLDSTQRQQARNILVNWSASTQAQKAEVTHGAQGLAFAVIDYLIDMVIQLDNRVRELEK